MKKSRRGRSQLVIQGSAQPVARAVVEVVAQVDLGGPVDDLPSRLAVGVDDRVDAPARLNLKQAFPLIGINDETVS